MSLYFNGDCLLFKYSASIESIRCVHCVRGLNNVRISMMKGTFVHSRIFVVVWFSKIRHRDRFIKIRYEHTQKKAQFPRTVIVSYDAVRGKFSDWPISNYGWSLDKMTTIGHLAEIIVLFYLWYSALYRGIINTCCVAVAVASRCRRSLVIVTVAESIHSMGKSKSEVVLMCDAWSWPTNYSVVVVAFSQMARECCTSSSLVPLPSCQTTPAPSWPLWPTHETSPSHWYSPLLTSQII